MGRSYAPFSEQGPVGRVHPSRPAADPDRRRTLGAAGRRRAEERWRKSAIIGKIGRAGGSLLARHTA